ncbi:alcohol dehydrogenase catalytic domain-containing protein [Maribacter litopenaei]|uniref:Alcohol dehydrogenase catalytic domain-containing protein n=1 Tax=Maribacter litopenaei TaxID=2976127 RepID=A0ABY5Y4G3_9FLAO|nr:alcohol dehydrogenase catalytic domain-containing protein [Maribacter litopenaei]UWX53906.1 alcohol dehydrogenase catalytic domain-containing protein [Maribacter litopenaei]
MRASYLEIPKTLKESDQDIPIPGSGDVRIKLRQIGICGSDVHLFLGHRPLSVPTVIGHEGLGEIDAVGKDVPETRIGERVVVEPNIPCGHCTYCKRGRGNICPNKRTIGLSEQGCFAEYVIVPSDFAWRVPVEVSDADAVTIEPTAAGVHALKISSAQPGDAIAVIGPGAIGLLLTHVALALGYKVYVSEINRDKIEVAQSMGAVPEEGNPLKTEWEKAGVMAIFECAGAAATVSMAIENAPRGAEVVILGLAGEKASFQPLQLVREGIRIVPSLIYDHPSDFKKTLELIASKTIRPGQIISKYMPFSELQSALELASKGTETKIVIEI